MNRDGRPLTAGSLPRLTRRAHRWLSSVNPPQCTNLGAVAEGDNDWASLLALIWRHSRLGRCPRARTMGTLASSLDRVAAQRKASRASTDIDAMTSKAANLPAQGRFPEAVTFQAPRGLNRALNARLPSRQYL
jgi:hypothetical protein